MASCTYVEELLTYPMLFSLISQDQCKIVHFTRIYKAGYTTIKRPSTVVACCAKVGGINRCS